MSPQPTIVDTLECAKKIEKNHLSRNFSYKTLGAKSRASRTLQTVLRERIFTAKKGSNEMAKRARRRARRRKRVCPYILQKSLLTALPFLVQCTVICARTTPSPSSSAVGGQILHCGRELQGEQTCESLY